jgi:hypothetical protein
MGNENLETKPEAGKETPETVSKVEYDAKIAELEKVRKDAEDIRMEIFTPEYLKWLDEKDRKEPPKKEEAPKDEDLSKLTPAQLFAKAKEESRREMQVELDRMKSETITTVGKEQTQKEVAAFARSHADYEKFRPVMYGLSLDPKNKDLSLQELYDASKSYITRLGEPSPEEKEKQRKQQTEKPGGDNQSYEKYSKMSDIDVAKESLEEVKQKLGSIPPAV